MINFYLSRSHHLYAPDGMRGGKRVERYDLFAAFVSTTPAPKTLAQTATELVKAAEARPVSPTARVNGGGKMCRWRRNSVPAGLIEKGLEALLIDPRYVTGSGGDRSTRIPAWRRSSRTWRCHRHRPQNRLTGVLPPRHSGCRRRWRYIVNLCRNDGSRCRAFSVPRPCPARREQRGS